jgi:LmbE family N-acetylglucosaminyl deacetylase
MEFVTLDGDAHLEIRSTHAISLAGIIRRIRPGLVLAPSLVQNQHPDHWRLGTLVRDATRLARYGGLSELGQLPSHTIDQLFFYAFDSESEPRDTTPVLYDVSAPAVIAAWTAAMDAHVSQVRSRRYVEYQLARARMHGLRAGVEYAIPLFPNDPIRVDSFEQIGRRARAF